MEQEFQNFVYVVQRREPDRICFGSGTERTTLFSRIKTMQAPGPQTYTHKEYKKIRSKRGMPGIASISKRETMILDSITPGPGKYSPPLFRQVKQNCAPFNTTGAAKKCFVPKLGPGPTVYNAHKVKKCKRTRFDYNFGKPCMVPCVEMVCINYPTEKCEKCEVPFEFGDHWHKNYTIYLCTPCMEEEHRLHELFTRHELLQFKKIRTCTFMHRHEGTSAKIKLLSHKDIWTKLRVENYLSLYSQCFGTKSKTELVVPLNDTM